MIDRSASYLDRIYFNPAGNEQVGNAIARRILGIENVLSTQQD